jgi:hypothetical protein
MSLSERLRDGPLYLESGSAVDDDATQALMDEAATTIDTQAAETERLRASLAEAVGEIRSAAAFLEDFQRADLDEPISDAGHTAGPLYQQQARRYLSAARDFVAKHSGGERE